MVLEAEHPGAYDKLVKDARQQNTKGDYIIKLEFCDEPRATFVKELVQDNSCNKDRFLTIQFID